MRESPCLICKAKNCPQKKCEAWKSWFLESWESTTAMFPKPSTGRIISVEGYKVFSGRMLWTPANPAYEPKKICGDWLYKPDADCWYCRGTSYPADTCAILEVF